MFSTIQIIILVVLTLLLFILGPYLIILREKKLNQNRIKKISPKVKIISHLFIGIIVISFNAFLMHVNNKLEVKKESKPVPTPQIEIKTEYYYKKGETYGTKYKLTEQDKPYFNEQGKWMLYNVGEISEPLIEKTYKFFGFNGFDQCQYKDKIPKDLAPFIREPFNN
jgi:amino acid transporter